MAGTLGTSKKLSSFANMPVFNLFSSFFYKSITVALSMALWTIFYWIPTNVKCEIALTSNPVQLIIQLLQISTINKWLSTSKLCHRWYIKHVDIKYNDINFSDVLHDYARHHTLNGLAINRLIV